MSATKKQVRENFRHQCGRRDKYRCACCSSQICDHLDTHHITDRTEMPNGGYVKENGITLCPNCHIKAETWHQSGGQFWEPGYHPDELYAKIGSSYAMALAASEKL